MATLENLLGVFSIQTEFCECFMILRTRDASVLNTCDIVVDVGAVFDPEKKRFDHHQR